MATCSANHPAPRPAGAEEMQSRFTRRHTLICKGLACILLLQYHLFSREAARGLCTLFSDKAPWLSFLKPIFELVATTENGLTIFLLLSGYGLCESWKRNTAGNAELASSNRFLIAFSWKRLLRLMIRFWIIFLLFVPWGPLFGRYPEVLFPASTPLKMLAKIAVNFSGMSNLLFGSSQFTFNATWWYMSVAILCYLFFPLLRRLADKHPLLLLPLILLCFAGAYLPYIKNVSTWISLFLIGMLLSEYGILDRMVRILSSRPAWIGAAAGVAAVVLTFLLRRLDPIPHYFLDPLYGMSWLLFCAAIPARIPALSTGLAFVGTHSGNIFLFHSFLCVYYFSAVTYSLKYPLFILLGLLAACLVISLCIETGVRLAGNGLLRLRKCRAGAP